MSASNTNAEVMPTIPKMEHSQTPWAPGPYLNNPQEVSSDFLEINTLEKEHWPFFDKAQAAVMKYHSKYDNSHNFEHIQRVVKNAYDIHRDIIARDPSFAEGLDALTVYLGCLVHDVGDHKYQNRKGKCPYCGTDCSKCGNVRKGFLMTVVETVFWPFNRKEDGPTEDVKVLLLECGASEEFASKMQYIAKNVSYQNEKRIGPEAMNKVLEKHPELRIIQDADRLDTLGAIGQGRCFAFGGANLERQSQSIQMAVQHHWQKLYELPSMMKTRFGMEEGQARWEEMCVFRKWWLRETDVSSVLRRR
ncbi:hypothetical protein P154DRAFT_520348 [Amniculicola lignicola CBS 123094]|uniref:HD/PDEase domain-containing protein n=1 Tax=Amniculicola lignicola CBS 123094 TaxID=1392246 RepID=A0A6A5WN80_9PLEO|nr:hypothetical protein P154DRAFT_520348 [Amniculicola lignicola CBS 123094]